MTIEAARQALEALEEFCECGSMLRPIERREALRAAISEAEGRSIEDAEKQEPVAWLVTTEMQDGTHKTYPLSGRYKYIRDVCDKGEPIPLYTAPPSAQQQWVGLTEEVVIEEAKWHLGEMQVENCGADNIQAFVRAILAKATGESK